MPVFECSRCNDMTYSAFGGTTHACAICSGTTFRVIEGAFDQARAAPRDLAAGDHSALVYDDPRAVAPFCARYLTQGLDTGERVVAGLPGELDGHVRALLAPDVEVLVEWREPGDIYGQFDADRVATMYDELMADDSRTTRILAGLDGAAVEGLDPVEFDRYERLSHAIISRHAANVVCLYDMTDRKSVV